MILDTDNKDINNIRIMCKINQKNLENKNDDDNYSFEIVGIYDDVKESNKDRISAIKKEEQNGSLFRIVKITIDTSNLEKTQHFLLYFHPTKRSLNVFKSPFDAHVHINRRIYTMCYRNKTEEKNTYYQECIFRTVSLKPSE